MSQALLSKGTSIRNSKWSTAHLLSNQPSLDSPDAGCGRREAGVLGIDGGGRGGHRRSALVCAGSESVVLGEPQDCRIALWTES